MGRNGYEPIPEVDGKKTRQTTKLSPQDRYPEANVEEAELLGLLDDVMEDPTMRVQLPTVKAGEIGISTSLWGIICSLMLPTIVFLFTVGLAVWISMDAVPDFLAAFVPYFPYLAALLAFLSGIPATRKRFRTQAVQIETILETTRPDASDTVQNAVLSVASKIDIVNMRLKVVVDSMRPKFSEAHAAEKQLKKMDPHIVIPDPRDVERELEGAKEEIDESIKFDKTSFPVTAWLPIHLKSSQLYQRRATKRTFSVFLILLVVAVFILTIYYPMTITEPPAEESTLLSDLVERFRNIFKSKDIKADATTLLQDMTLLLKNALPMPLIFAVVVYAMVFLQMLLVYSRTSASATAAIVNHVRSNVSEKTNHVLRQQGILFLCQDILETRMGRVKSQLLKMITQLYKIDMLMSLTSTDESSPSPTRITQNNSSPLSPSGRRRITNMFGSKSS